jgi:ABC-type uncharacterized transport system fused permease/ATPase subunit
MRTAKIATMMVFTIALTAIVTSIAWWVHFKSTVKFLTITSLKSDIEFDLNVLHKSNFQEIAALRSDAEEHLAVSAVLFAGVLRDANSSERSECVGLIDSVRKYKFQTTNEITESAITILQQ